MQYLTEKGVAADRMTSAGYGEIRPVADNDTDEGRELNRRVELKIVEDSGKGIQSAASASPEIPAAAAFEGGEAAAGGSLDGSVAPATP